MLHYYFYIYLKSIDFLNKKYKTLETEIKWKIQFYLYLIKTFFFLRFIYLRERAWESEEEGQRKRES